MIKIIQKILFVQVPHRIKMLVRLISLKFKYPMHIQPITKYIIFIDKLYI
jgi:hypothetical protein